MKYHIDINQLVDLIIKIIFTIILLGLIFAMVFGAARMLLNIWDIFLNP